MIFIVNINVQEHVNNLVRAAHKDEQVVKWRSNGPLV